MSIHQLNAIAGKILGMASTLPYSPWDAADQTTPDDQVRDSNEGIERLLACAAGYAFPLPTEAVPSPKLWFGEQYGKALGTLVSLVGEQRILNGELIAMGAQGAWLFRYATAYDLSALGAFGQISGQRIAGLADVRDYCRDRDIVGAATVLTAIEQLGKMIVEFQTCMEQEPLDA